jgi:hypothetical protein
MALVCFLLRGGSAFVRFNPVVVYYCSKIYYYYYYVVP